MDELERVLKAHGEAYPLLQPQDAVKLIYQNEFGGKHMQSEPIQALHMLREEYKGLVHDPVVPLFEDIGNGHCRLNLKAIGQEADLTAVFRLWAAQCAKGNRESFLSKLDILEWMTRENRMPFTAFALSEYLQGYIQAGLPMVRHSEIYKASYRPAYRVVESRCRIYFPLICAVEQLISQKDHVVIAIDGRCGSGKTTLAAFFTEFYDCAVVSMDDFFLPPGLRTKNRLEEPGGNIHYERFVREAAEGIQSGKAFDYRVFDCKSMTYAGSKTILPKPLTICEGTYSLHPEYASMYDLKVFTTCGEALQNDRILNRSGRELHKRFMEQWIPMEERYFKAFAIPESCDFMIDTGADL